MRFEHGGNIYQNQIQYDFSVNVNPFGMTEKCMEAAKRGIELCMHYPDTRAESLRHAIATKYDVSADHIVIGNGAAELIYAFCHAVRPRQARMVAPTFQEYEAAVSMVGGTALYTLLDETRSWLVDDTFVESITEEDDVVFVCNPNNPTGRQMDKALLARLVKKCKEVQAYLVIDECFLPFLRNEQAFSYMHGACEGHVVVLRAFTKIYAMAGLRLGYMYVVDERLKNKLREQLSPWNTSIPAQLAGVAALAEDDYVNASVDALYRERTLLVQALQPYVEKVYESEANFVLVKAEKAFAKKLLSKGILIRSCGEFEGLDDTYFRIAVRTNSENVHLLETIKMLYETDGIK